MPLLAFAGLSPRGFPAGWASSACSSRRSSFWRPVSTCALCSFRHSTLVSDSLGNIMTKQLYGTAQFVYFEEAEDVPIMYISTSEEMLLCATVPGMSKALESGLRDRLLRLMRGNASGR